MKTLKTILIFAGCLLSAGLFSQSSHLTIDNVKVTYKAAPQNSLSTTTNTVFEMSVIPTATINLKTQTNVSKIYFKIQSVTTNSVIYNVNYNLNASTLTSNGLVLFNNSNGNISISSGQIIPLKPYTISVQTEDTLQNLSTIFSLIQ